jgi:ParB family chromosome partitioning protein
VSDGPGVGIAIQIVPITEIDGTDRRFALSYPGGAGERLISSIAAVGIIQPLILLQGDGRASVICGLRRLAAAEALEMQEVPARVFEGTERDALIMAIHDNLERGHNVVEKALCLARVERLGFSRRELLETMSLLGLEAHEKVLRAMLGLGTATDAVRDLAFRKKLSLKNITLLMAFEEPERSAVARRLAGLHLTDSLVREILELLLLLKARGTSPDMSGDGTVESGPSLRDLLKALANPRRKALEGRLAELKGECRMPPGLDIKVDPFFEKEYIDILVRIRSESEGQALVDRLVQLFQQGQVGRILELTRG